MSAVHPAGENNPTATIENQPPSALQNVDEAFEHCGSFGRYQVLIQVVFTYFVLGFAYSPLLSYFIADNPPWICSESNSTIQTNNTFCQQNAGRQITPDNVNFKERCNMDRRQWTYVSSSDYSVVTEFDLVCSRETYGGVIASCYFLGGAIGTFLCGRISDAYGRRKVMIVSLLVNIISSAGCAFVQNVWQIIVLRLILGASWVPCYNTCAVYVMELMPPKYRTTSGLLYQVYYSISVLLLNGVGFFERRWRHLQIFVTLPSLFSLLSFFFLHESPRWLLAMGKVDKAERAFTKIAKVNGAGFSVRFQASQTTNEKVYTYMDFFRCGSIAMVTVAQGLLWLTSAMLYIAIGLESAKLGGNMYLVFAFSVLIEIPAGLIPIYICDRFGRKKSILGALLAGSLLCGSLAVIPRSYALHHNTVIVAVAVAAKFMVTFSYNSLYIWTFEINPTVVRSQAFSLCAMLERMGAVFSPFLVGSLQSLNYILPFITMSVMGVLAVLFALVLPETNNMPTREVYQDFFAGKTAKVNDLGREKGIGNESLDDEL